MEINVMELTLISHDLCPYVQRAAIALAEKGAPFRRVDIDLANKPDWFLAISPRGKVPLLKVGDAVIFESAVIAEYLDETHAPVLHPADPLARACHRGWIEFASAALADLWTIQTTRELADFNRAVAALADKFQRMDSELGAGPFFAGTQLCLVDAAWAPVLRYVDVLDGTPGLTQLTPCPDCPRGVMLWQPGPPCVRRWCPTTPGVCGHSLPGRAAIWRPAWLRSRRRRDRRAGAGSLTTAGRPPPKHGQAVGQAPQAGSVTTARSPPSGRF
jgi:glutathione S-transferase